MRILIFVVCLLFVISGSCSCYGASKGGSGSSLKISDYNSLFNRGKTALKTHYYRIALESFQEVLSLYPFSDLAKKAQVYTAFTHYIAGSFEDVIVNCNSYISLYPRGEDIAYMYYLKAVSYYNQISDIYTDKGSIMKAYYALEDVTLRARGSKYINDVNRKLELIYDRLAAKEMDIGRSYLFGTNYIASIPYFTKVLKEYAQTIYVAEALYRLCKAYAALGLIDEAQRYALVLEFNFPQSHWVEKAHYALN